jgi:hypothetical protein
MRPLTALLLFLCAAVAAAAPPTLDLPAEVRPANGYARLTPKTDAVSVVYVALDGVYPFPSEELKNPRAFVLPAAGLKDGRYRFVAVAAGKGGEQSQGEFVVVVGKADPGPEPAPGPSPKPEPKPAPVAGTLYVVVVEETSARTPELARVLNDAAFWGGLKGKDVLYRFYDKDAPEVVTQKYLPYANKAGLPAVLLMDKAGKVLDAKKLAATADVDAMLREVGR